MTYTHYFPKVQNHLTFGLLVKILSTLPADAPLYAGAKNYYPELNLRSYRGYCEDMEIDTKSTPVTVGEFLNLLLEARGTEVEAYKGGAYTVADESYLWIGYEGGTNSSGMNGVCINGDGSYILIGCREDD